MLFSFSFWIYSEVNDAGTAMKRYLREAVQDVLSDYPEWVKPLLLLILVGFLVFAVPFVAGQSFQILGSWGTLGVIAVTYLFFAWMIS